VTGVSPYSNREPSHSHNRQLNGTKVLAHETKEAISRPKRL
jgi:hypothetical protein